jgi:hypothetical protein
MIPGNADGCPGGVVPTVRENNRLGISDPS